MKQCTKCQKLKPKSDFVVDHSKKDTLSVYCKSCKSVYKKSWGKRNKEKVKEYNRVYHNKTIPNPQRKIIKKIKIQGDRGK